jgi:copper chaperone
VTRATVDITGMHCGGCVGSVERVLSKLPGVSAREVSVGRAIVTFEGASVTEASLRDAIDAAGFEVTAVSLSEA